MIVVRGHFHLTASPHLTWLFCIPSTIFRARHRLPQERSCHQIWLIDHDKYVDIPGWHKDHNREHIFERHLLHQETDRLTLQQEKQLQAILTTVRLDLPMVHVDYLADKGISHQPLSLPNDAYQSQQQTGIRHHEQRLVAELLPTILQQAFQSLPPRVVNQFQCWQYFLTLQRATYDL